MRTDILIIGAGLCGLSLAAQLQRAGRDFILVEARERIGGRILTAQTAGAHFDLGPAWFWPGQPRIERLVKELGLTRFDQFADGILSYEDEQGRVQRGQGYASMQGSYRLAGGLHALTDALAAQLPVERILPATEVTALKRQDTGIAAETAARGSIMAQRIVLAMPPRIAGKITCSPALTQETLAALTEIPTWMAGQAKAVAVYEAAFWRDEGLSGDAMSRAGPMVEIHDASPLQNGPYALFGFIGVPAHARTDEDRLREALRAQLVRLFGSGAANPLALHIKDWAADPFTAIKADSAPVYTHPNYGLPQAMQNIWEGRLIFSGTETAEQFGGYLEGALEAAETAYRQLES